MKTITHLTIHFCFLFFSYSITAQVLEQDSLALVAFYNSTGGPNWDNNSNWLSGPVSTWYGITVEGDRVIEISLYQNNLNGTIPDDIGNFTKLKKFKVGHDENLMGEIPETIGNLSELEMFVICDCSIVGTITNNICNCSSLKSLHLWENNLTGPIPSEIGNLDSLKYLYLHDNQLSGTIPPELGHLTNLWELQLNDNQLIGTIPEEITLYENMFVFDLSNNQLSGELPEYFSNFFFANESNFINLSYNNFSGPVPDEWGDLSFLIDELNLSHNNFTSLPEVNYNWELTFFHIEGNNLAFEHIESHYQSYQQGLYYFFYYQPQDYLMDEIDTVLVPGSNYSIYAGTGGEFVSYKWYKNGEVILESTEADSLHLENITYTDTGIYTCKAENSLIYNLNLYREPVHISVDTGTIVFLRPDRNKEFNMYPNPAKNEFHISLKGFQGQCKINIYEMDGNRVLNKKVNFDNNIFEQFVDIRKLKDGIYLVELLTNSERFTEKIIINKQGINH